MEVLQSQHQLSDIKSHLALGESPVYWHPGMHITSVDIFWKKQNSGHDRWIVLTKVRNVANVVLYRRFSLENITKETNKQMATR